MWDMSFILPSAAVLVGGVLIVAARYHRLTFRRIVKDDRRKERRLYWGSWAIGGPLVTVGMIPSGWKIALGVGSVLLLSAVIYGPFPWNRRRWAP